MAFEIDQNFEDCEGRMFGQVYNALPAISGVPSGIGAFSTDARKITVIADTPKRSQANIPSSICQSRRSTTRPPTSVRRRLSGVRPPI